jgi:hypothetical protein
MNWKKYWAAGFFDGEGNTRCSKDGRLSLQIGQVEKDPLLRFQEAVNGLGKIYGPGPPKMGIWQSQYTYSAYNKYAQQIIDILLPYLCEVKVEQACDALTEYRILKESRPRNQPYICGEARTYTKGCRCSLCRAAGTEKSKEWRNRPH